MFSFSSFCPFLRCEKKIVYRKILTGFLISRIEFSDYFNGLDKINLTMARLGTSKWAPVSSVSPARFVSTGPQILAIERGKISSFVSLLILHNNGSFLFPIFSYSLYIVWLVELFGHFTGQCKLPDIRNITNLCGICGYGSRSSILLRFYWSRSTIGQQSWGEAIVESGRSLLYVSIQAELD